jgi:hypothetical protein
METREPYAQAAVVGTHVLHVDGAFGAAADPFFSAQVKEQFAMPYCRAKAYTPH